MFKRRQDWKTWNTRFAGKVAGSLDGHGYLNISVNSTRYLGHRIAWAIHNGKWPLQQIDHINGEGTDNRIINLRAVSPQENTRNMALGAANTSGIIGVNFHTCRRKWRAVIMVDRKDIHLGYFLTIEQAAAARKAAEKKHGFHPNHGRLTPP